MKPRKTPASLTVPAEPQLEWHFDEVPGAGPRSECDADSAASTAAVVFKQPDPKTLFVGNQRLDRFLEAAGLDEALVMAELLGSLDCWASFEAAYRPGGRAPHHPRLLVGLILLGLMEGRTSLRGLEQLARADVRAWWVTGGLCPDHSTLGKFINRHRQVLTGEFFEELTRKVIEATGSGATRLAGDGTVIEAVASRLHLVKQEAAEETAAEAKARSEAAPDDEVLKQQAELAREVAEAAKDRSADRKAKKRKNPEAPVSPVEPQAMVQPLKNKAVRPSYKPSILVTEDRVITGQTVDPTNEAKMVEPMVEQSERISSQQVDELLLDAGYFSALVMQLCYSSDIRLLCPQGQSSPDGAKAKSSDKQIPKNRFRYDEERDQYVCPAGQRLAKLASAKDARGLRYVQYVCDRCDGCSYRPKCTRRAGGRTIKRYEHEELTEALMEVMEHPQAQRVYRKRQGMVEPVFGEIRYVQGLMRFRRRGLSQVRLEFALHAAAHNVRRYLRITTRLEERGSEGAEAATGRVLALMSLLSRLTAPIGGDAGPRVLLVRARWCGA